jgi:hypothetical protein
MILRLVAFLVVLMLAVPANAVEYGADELADFARTLVRFKAFDINDEDLLDEYAMVTDCELVETFYRNDFQWSEVRKLILQSISQNRDSFPVKYHYDALLQLDRYDFKDKNFRFTNRTVVRDVNTFTFTLTNRHDFLCNGQKLQYFPTTYVFVIGTPISIGGMPFAEDDAKALLQRLDAAGNADRIIYTRFNFTVNFVGPLHIETYNGGAAKKYLQNGSGDGAVRLDSRLNSVDFYEDPQMTKLVYSYKP